MLAYFISIVNYNLCPMRKVKDSPYANIKIEAWYSIPNAIIDLHIKLILMR